VTVAQIPQSEEAATRTVVADAARLVALRGGRSQTEVARGADITRKTLRSAEHGRPIYASTLRSLARYYGVDDEDTLLASSSADRKAS
jgi:hypothetical protein